MQKGGGEWSGIIGVKMNGVRNKIDKIIDKKRRRKLKIEQNFEEQNSWQERRKKSLHQRVLVCNDRRENVTRESKEEEEIQIKGS